MSLWDELIEAGAKMAGDPDAIRSMVKAVRPMVAEHLDGDPLAIGALDLIDENADTLAKVAPRGLIGLTGKFWVLGEIEARESYIQHSAGLLEVLAAQHAAHAATVLESQYSAWREDILPVIKAIAPVLPQLLPFLLAVV